MLVAAERRPSRQLRTWRHQAVLRCWQGSCLYHAAFSWERSIQIVASVLSNFMCFIAHAFSLHWHACPACMLMHASSSGVPNRDGPHVCVAPYPSALLKR